MIHRLRSVQTALVRENRLLISSALQRVDKLSFGNGVVLRIHLFGVLICSSELRRILFEVRIEEVINLIRIVLYLGFGVKIGSACLLRIQDAFVKLLHSIVRIIGTCVPFLFVLLSHIRFEHHTAASYCSS